MTARRLIGVFAFGLALAVPAVANAGFEPTSAGGRYVPGEALVRYERGIDAAGRRELRSDAGVDFESSVALPRVQVVSFNGSVRAAIARLEDRPGVAYAQPNYLYHALANPPNDTHFGHLWGLGSTPGVGVLPAWDRSRGAGQVIAIVDTGIDLTHPDLAPNLWTGPGGIHGRDFVDNDDSPDDFNLHGTHVAGTAAAIANNGLGVAGVAPEAQIMAVRVLDSEGSGSSSQIADGIVFAATNGAGVVNLSLGGPAGGGDQAMQDAISQAELRNTVVVAAAGNGGDDGVGDDNDVEPTTPCTLPNANLICVAALERSGARSSFSNFGPTTVDVGAPGGDGSGDPDGDVLSAKPSWVPAFAEDFEGGLGDWTATNASGGDWGIETNGGVGASDAATDSPGSLYENNADSQLQTTDPVDLTGRRGCRLDYVLHLVNVRAGDLAGVGVVTGAGNIGQSFEGNSGDFFRVEQSISDVDGRADVKPTFLFNSDGAIVGDGAYIDNFNLLCRGQVYPNTIAADNAAAGGDYTAIAGTSMASPHVAGVAALVRAVDPGAPPSQVVQALRNGAKPVPALAGATVTGGAVDAVGAMDAALALPNPQEQPPEPAPPHKPRFGKLKFNPRTGIVTMVVRGDRGTNGAVTLTGNITAARVRRVARRSFRIGSTGRATVKLKLSRPARKQLKRTRKLRLRAKLVTKNAAGLSSSARATIRIRLHRRR